MKNILPIIIALLLTTCKKADDGCGTCSIVMVNITEYPFKVSIDGNFVAKIQPFQTHTRAVTYGASHHITAPQETPYAGYTFDKWVKCDEACSAITVELK